MFDSLFNKVAGLQGSLQDSFSITLTSGLFSVFSHTKQKCKIWNEKIVAERSILQREHVKLTDDDETNFEAYMVYNKTVSVKFQE